MNWADPHKIHAVKCRLTRQSHTHTHIDSKPSLLNSRLVKLRVETRVAQSACHADKILSGCGFRDVTILHVIRIIEFSSDTSLSTILR